MASLPRLNNANTVADLVTGAVWEYPGGTGTCRVEILDRPFLWDGKWWVVTLDSAYHYPSVETATRILEHGRRLTPGIGEAA